MVRYDPEDHDNFELVGAIGSGEAGGNQVSRTLRRRIPTIRCM
jgi:hypothetical protein